ncbi:MAG: hypothetical protein VX405_11030 [Myxococcota bacterium]|jgi:hypothetical protein|nr:hypothetical protein [Myxococcota bacterium]
MTPLKLLQSDKPRAVLEGIERLTSAGDGHAFDQLLNGIRYQAPTAQDFLLAFAGRLLPNEHFKPADDSSRQLIACHELAVLGLVCEAPESSILGNAFKQVVTSLALGPFGFTGHIPRVDQLVRSQHSNVLPGLPHGWLAKLPKLERLDLSGMPVERLDWLEGCDSLGWLRLRGTHQLTELATLPTLPLETLDLDGSRSLKDLSGLKKLNKLKYLDLAGCTSLTHVSALREAPDLQWLNLSRCERLVSLEGIEGMASLRELDVGGCLSLQDISPLGKLVELEELDLSLLPKLEHVDALHPCQRLKRVVLAGCEQLEHVDGLRDQEELAYLDLSDCNRLQPSPPSRLMVNRSLTPTGVAVYQERLRASE